MYSLRIEAERRTAQGVNLASAAEFPPLPAAAPAAPDRDDEEEEDEDAHDELETELPASADGVPFSSGNPRVEHITGVVHLYRELAHEPRQPSTNTATSPAPAWQGQAARLAASSRLPVSGSCGICRAAREQNSRAQPHIACCACFAMLRLPHYKLLVLLTCTPLEHPHHHCHSPSLSHSPQEGRHPMLCCLAIPADMSVAEFCTFCGAYLSAIRSMRVLRREARQRIVSAFSHAPKHFNKHKCTHTVHAYMHTYTVTYTHYTPNHPYISAG